MNVRVERAICVSAVALMWLFFFVQALHTPVLLDDWYQLTWHRHHPLSLSSIWEFAHYNYFNFNPRVGDVLLMLVNGPAWIHLVFTPLVELSVLPLAFLITFGRWPRLRLRDFELLLLLQALIWIVMPIPGVVYFYRPFATNYIWSFAIMLAFFVPYRLALVRDSAGPARLWVAPLMLVFGWLTGMGNEHTGPTAMLAMAIFLYVAYRKRRLSVWMIAGAIGLYVGYVMLFFAPGQVYRYAGMAVQNTPVKMITTRGPNGLFEVALDFIAEGQIGINLVLIAFLIAYRRKLIGALSRLQWVTFFALLAGAAGMVGTQFASPTVGERLFFAPGVLLVGGLLIIIDWLYADRAARRFLLIAGSLLFAYQAFRMVVVLKEGYDMNQARIAILRATPPNTIAKVPAFGGDLWKRTRWWWGDDLQYASLRQYVANEVYDLKGIEYDRHYRWVEPTPVDHFVIKRTFDPPLSPEEDAKLEPRYVPIFWEWTLMQLRRSRALGPIKYVKGHKLVRYTVDSVGSRFVDPKGRPVRVFDWNPKKLRFVDGRMFDDDNEAPYVRAWQPTVPPNVVDVYVEACGKTKRVDLLLAARSNRKEDVYDQVGPLIPITLSCLGTHSTYMCEPDVCWFAGRYWR